MASGRELTRQELVAWTYTEPGRGLGRFVEWELGRSPGAVRCPALICFIYLLEIVSFIQKLVTMSFQFCQQAFWLNDGEMLWRASRT